MKEIIIINLLDKPIAQLTVTLLYLKYSGFSFKVTQYYSEHQHVVTNQEVPKEQLLEMQGYAMGVSDILLRMVNP